jgi:hypothetical protein
MRARRSAASVDSDSDSDARDGAPSADAIRAWMGTFSNIKVSMHTHYAILTALHAITA